MKKSSLLVIRQWLKKLRAQAKSTGNKQLLDAQYEFLFLAPDEDEHLVITEGEFFADPGENKGGHPRVGTYTVRVLDSNSTELIEEKSGDWQSEGSSPRYEDEKDAGSAGNLRSIGAANSITIGNLVADNARVRAQLLQTEERERVARADRDTMVDALHMAKDEQHKMSVILAEHEYQRQQAEQRELAALDELEAIRRRGGEFAPAAAEAVKTLFDRGMEQFGQVSAAKAREDADQDEQVLHWAGENCMAALVDRDCLRFTIELVQQGRLPWDEIRAMIWLAYHVDAGDEIPGTSWQPPEDSENAQQDPGSQVQ